MVADGISSPISTFSGRPDVSSAPTQNVATLASGQGNIIRGEIVAILGKGDFVLRTDKTDITIRTDQVLRVGNEVVIKLDTVLGQPQAKIISINGQAPELANTGGTLNPNNITDTVSTGGRAPQPAAILGTTLPQLPSSGVVQATLISAPPTNITYSLPTNLQPQTGGNILPGSQITLGLVSAEFLTPAAQIVASETLPQTANVIISSGSSATPQVQIAQPQISDSSVVITSSGLPTPTSPSVGTLPQTTVVPQTAANQTAPVTTINIPNIPINVVQVQSVERPLTTVKSTSLTAANEESKGSSAPISGSLYAAYGKSAPVTSSGNSGSMLSRDQAKTALGNGQLQANVLSSEPDGNVLLQTPLGTVSLPNFLTSSGPISSATQLLFNLLGISAPNNATPQTPATTATSTELESTLSKALGALQARQPDLAAKLLQALPQTGANFAAKSLAFMSAVSSGNFEKWIGADVIEQLQKKGQSQLVDKLKSEFTALSTSFNAPAQNNWQMLLFPFVHQGEMQQARFFLKKEKQKKDDAKKNPDSRFVLEVCLSDMGDVQFDGLIRKQEDKTKFDLVIRTIHPLSKEDQNEITQIFNDASELTGFVGSISIQSVKEFPVKPLDEMLQGDAESIMV